MNEFQEPGKSPEQFLVSVIMTKRPPPSERPWMGDSWRVFGVIVDNRTEAWGIGPTRVRWGPDGEQYLWSGLAMHLFKDEAESYYHNLMSDNPSIFVMTAVGEQGVPEPFLVSASFDEANAYLEAEGDAEAVPMPPEIYQWVEGFVIAHYLPERKVKRKRRNWSEETRVKR